MGFSGFYFLFREHIKEIESRKQTEQSHYQDIIHKRELQLQLENAKNSYLKAQINPHLLFNTLSFIYQDILLSSPKSAEVIMELSDIMRYSINCEFNEPTVPLKEELKQVKKLVGLQRKRFEDEIFVDVIYKQEVAKVKFIPLVLVTLTENIFKHGMFQEPEFPATLRIEVQNNQLVISCINHPKRRTSIESMNKGLDNIRQRLGIAYGPDATINYGTSGDLFYVRITAPLSIAQPASKTE
jgi:LytS/YehU family sensor histidine kinase